MRFFSAWTEAERALAEIEHEPGPEAKMRRVAIRNALADLGYDLAKTLKDSGRHEDADMMHRAANRHWSAVVSELSTDVEPPKPKPVLR
jgi:hypothetical protein